MAEMNDPQFADDLLRYLLERDHKRQDEEIAKAKGWSVAEIRHHLRRIKIEESNLLNIQEFDSGTVAVAWPFRENIQYFLGNGGFEAIYKKNKLSKIVRDYAPNVWAGLAVVIAVLSLWVSYLTYERDASKEKQQAPHMKAPARKSGMRDSN